MRNTKYPKESCVFLADADLRERGPWLIEPFDPARVQPASYDLTLHSDILVPVNRSTSYPVDIRRDDPKHSPSTYFNKQSLSSGGYTMNAGSSLLASTAECVRIPRDLVARVEGRSTLGRLFLAVHVTAGWIDPGYEGRITLELVNHGPWRLVIYPGMPIAQINFATLTQGAVTLYGDNTLNSHYQYQEGPVAAAGKRGKN